MAQKRVKNVLAVLFILAGAAALFYGFRLYDSLQQDLLNRAQQLFVKNTEQDLQAIFFMAGGGISVIIGLVMLLVPGRRR